MNFQSENRAGVAFVGLAILGVGIGLIVSLIADNWAYVGAGAVVGVGLGFVTRSFFSE